MLAYFVILLLDSCVCQSYKGCKVLKEMLQKLILKSTYDFVAYDQ
jgi:hypothetical protein